MPYTTIKPPFTLKFREMSTSELKDYYRWFLLTIPERIQELTPAVKETPGFESWQPDYSRSSLQSLGEWFKSQVETRPKTTEELEKMGKFWSGPPELARELTDKTISLAMDIGMYLSRALLRHHPTLQWQQPLRAKNYVDYGQPVLGGFGEHKEHFNPVRMILTQGYAIAGHDSGAGDLVRIYDIWSKNVHGTITGTSDKAVSAQ